MVAHVRQATVGVPQTENTHPFTYRSWTFAHNGTVTAFDDLGPRLAAQTDADLRRHQAGTTDSETVFYWLLARVARFGLPLDAPCHKPSRLGDVLVEAVEQLAAWSEAAETTAPARLNLLLTEGRVLVVSRWKNSLHWIERVGVRDCEICGFPHVEHEPAVPYRAALVASEPISGEAWQEAPDPSILLIDGDVHLQVRRL